MVGGMTKRYVVRLTASERDQLTKRIGAGVGSARTLTHARILLKADQGEDGPSWIDEQIAEAVESSASTVARVRQQYVEEGLEAALTRRAPRREYVRKLTGEHEAQLIALACGQPPAGQARWTLRLLADRLVELEVIEAVSYQTVRRVLKKTNCSPI